MQQAVNTCTTQQWLQWADSLHVLQHVHNAAMCQGRGVGVGLPATLLLILLCVADPCLRVCAQVPCVCNEFIGELLRGIRMHFTRFLDNLKDTGGDRLCTPLRGSVWGWRRVCVHAGWCLFDLVGRCVTQQQPANRGVLCPLASGRHCAVVHSLNRCVQTTCAIYTDVTVG